MQVPFCDGSRAARRAAASMRSAAKRRADVRDPSMDAASSSSTPRFVTGRAPRAAARYSGGAKRNDTVVAPP